MLCVLFHGRVQQRFFIVAEELHRRSQRAGILLQLPEVWLEEMASHLLQAREYSAIVGDDHLRQSSNAYVAYFAARRSSGAHEFDAYLEEFGLTDPLRRRAGVDWVGARRELEGFLRNQFAHYGVTVVPTPAANRHHDRVAQKARAFKQAYLRDQEVHSSVAALEQAWRGFKDPA